MPTRNPTQEQLARWKIQEKIYRQRPDVARRAKVYKKTPEYLLKQKLRRQEQRMDPSYKAREKEVARLYRLRNKEKIKALARARMTGISRVYFVRAGAEGPIKIGYTTKTLQARLTELQGGNHQVLKVLGAVLGGKQEEQALHNEFRNQRIRGEWFHPAAELLQKIQHLVFTG